MKFAAIVCLCLLAVPAFAQPAPTYKATAQMLLDQALQCENLATVQIQDLQKKLEEVTKERDALRPK